MDHHFNTEVAQQYGVGEAIILHNICFWQKKNMANNNNYHDGRYWVYNSVKAYTELFPYYTDRQIRSILKKLEDKECLHVGRYNKMKIDRTKWYSASDEIMLIHGIKPNDANCQMQLPKNVNAITQISKCNDVNMSMQVTKMSNGCDQNVKPIPYINTDKRKDNNTQSKKLLVSTCFDFDLFWTAYDKKVDRKRCESIYAKINEADRKKIKDTIDLYVSTNKNRQYRKNPQTYLNGNCWEDDLTDVVVISKNQPKSSTPTEKRNFRY
jgi:hypothetical protein